MRATIATTAALLVAAAIGTACGKSAPRPPEPVPAATSSTAATQASPPAVRTTPAQRTDVFIGESFSPRTGDAAIHAFVPEIAAVDSGGECNVIRTGGSGATIVTASFPTRTAAQTQATITFDSSGRLIRYSERRGVAKIPSTKGMTDPQRDSTIRTVSAATRSTSISLDYAIDQAVVMNRGGGKPTDAILGTVRAIERLDKLGPPIARVERMRRLCGV
jgi:hypothetical protein